MQYCLVCPAVKIIDLCAARGQAPDNIARSPEQASEMVVIISGDLNNDDHVASALRITGVERQRNVGAIIVLMMRANAAATEGSDSALQMQSQLADCLFIVNAQEYDFVLERFIRSIVSPFAPHAHIGCDWNDLRTMLKFGRGGVRNSLRSDVRRAKAEISMQSLLRCKICPSVKEISRNRSECSSPWSPAPRLSRDASCAPFRDGVGGARHCL